MQGRRSPTHRALAALLAITSTACYSYVPLDEGIRPDPGDEVRVYLSEEAEDGRRELQGIVEQSGGDALVLSTRLAPARTGTFDASLRESRSIAYARIGRIERPQVDGLKTGALVVGGIGVLAGFMAIVLGESDSGTPGDGGGNGPSLRLTIP